MRKIIIFSVLILTVLFLGCIYTDTLGEASKKPSGDIGKPECKKGTTQDCVTVENCSGIQACVDKKWSSCVDTPNDNCPCIENWNCASWTLCVDGNQSRTCVDLGGCFESYQETRFCGECANGTTQACVTTENCVGTQTCVNNFWNLCADVPNDNCPICIEDWMCNPWTLCIDGNQSRTCLDDNNCGTTNDMPPEIQICDSNSS